MKTLYDLLGALPDDDAEDIRAAFRKAVKESHPDVNPGDLDAALRFRQVVRANDILGDKEQRAAYDRLLAAAQDEQQQDSKLAVVARVHKVASGVMAAAGASAVALTGYLLFTHMSAASVVPLKPIVVTTNRVKPHEVPARSIQTAAVSPDVVATGDAAPNVAGDSSAAGDQASPRASKGEVANSTEQERPLCGPNAPASCITEVAFQNDAPSSDARTYHDRGMASFQKGDLTAALAELDMAVQLDPRYQEAYIDRGIVFYRMHKFDRAFADVAAAKRIEKANRTMLDAMAKRQPLRPLKLEPPKADTPRADVARTDTPRVATAAPMPPRMSTATPAYGMGDPSRAP